MTNINFIPFPILTSGRITLRELSIDDQQNIFALRSDKEINKYLGRQESRTIEDAVNFINTVTNNIKKNNSIYWVITLSNTKTFVGTICLFNFSPGESTCEIGYELLTKFQGQGIMREAAEQVIDYAFQTLKVQKIIAFTHSRNQKSTNLLTKCNFIRSIEGENENPGFNIYTLTNSDAHG